MAPDCFQIMFDCLPLNSKHLTTKSSPRQSSPFSSQWSRRSAGRLGAKSSQGMRSWDRGSQICILVRRWIGGRAFEESGGCGVGELLRFRRGNFGVTAVGLHYIGGWRWAQRQDIAMENCIFRARMEFMGLNWFGVLFWIGLAWSGIGVTRACQVETGGGV